jgi:hypothetical protein
MTMQLIVTEWLKRILGFGAVAAGPWIADRTGDAALGDWVATGVAVVGGIVLNKALPYVLPTRKKLDGVAGTLRR